MAQPIHSILGPSGAIGRALVKELEKAGNTIRLIERSSKVEGYEITKADLLDENQAAKAIEGSSYVYLCVGLPYNIKSWSEGWPVLMDNVIYACEKAGAVLIFLDNIYMYGPPPLAVPFNENHNQEPISKKGKIRKIVSDKMIEAMDSQRMKGVILRAPDFYGPFAINSMLYDTMVKRVIDNKAPQSLFDVNIKHTYGYTEDIAKAMLLLAENSKAYGQVYHSPSNKAITLTEIAEMINEIEGIHYKLQKVPGLIKKILPVFIPILKEVYEMEYQFKSEYIMDDSKFMSLYPEFEVTPLKDGLRKMIEGFRNN